MCDWIGHWVIDHVSMAPINERASTASFWSWFFPPVFFSFLTLDIPSHSFFFCVSGHFLESGGLPTGTLFFFLFLLGFGGVVVLYVINQL